MAEIQDSIRELAERYNMGILLTDHQFRETLEVTDRCYLIREGRVFAYGNREQILENPDVRRHYIGERFDVGHLLDRRRPASIAHHAVEPAPHESEVSDSMAAYFGHYVTTELILGHSEEVSVQSTSCQDSANLPPPPPLPEGPVPGVYEEPDY